jgi:hypothetical protein
VNPLVLQCSEERLGHGIVVTLTGQYPWTSPLAG